MRKLWKHFRLLLAKRIRYKITRGGLLFTFAILVVGWGAIISGNNMLFLIVAAMLGWFSAASTCASRSNRAMRAASCAPPAAL